MKKSILYSFIAASAALSLTACSSDELEGTQNDGKALVAFTVQAPNGIDTRAYADGTTANKLKYAVYDNSDKFLFEGSQDIPMKTTVTLNLATDNTYKVVFWAESASSPYTIDWTNKTMTYKPAEAKAQDENRDAFYKEVELTVTGNSQQTVELRRPFAQLNIGTDDVAAAKAAGLEVTESQVTVSGVPTTLNLLDGTVSGSENVTYSYAAIPNDETFPVKHADAKKSYEYLSMNYILMAEDKQTTDVTFKFKGATEHERTYASVPVQRNYRTNIYGSLLTNTASFNVEIKPEFETPDYDVPQAYKVSSMDQLKEAIANGETNLALEAGTYQIPSGFDASKGLTLSSASGKPEDVTIVCQKTNEQWAHNANVTFKNITMDRTTADAYVGAIQHAVAENYEGCIIKGVVQVYAPSAKFLNCKFVNEKSNGTGGYSLYVYGDNATVVVDNCEFNGVSKAILVYCEGNNWKTDLTVSNTKFTASASSTDKAAIDIHNDFKQMSGTLRIKNCTATGFTGKNGGLWAEVINSTRTDTQFFNVFVDDVQVQTAQ